MAVKRFIDTIDKNGKVVRVFIVNQTQANPTIDVGNIPSASLEDLQLANGDPVRRLSETELEIVFTKGTLRIR